MTSDPAKIAQLEVWMQDKEGENCEFKEWKNKGDFELMGRYLCALANEGPQTTESGLLRPRLSTACWRRAATPKATRRPLTADPCRPRWQFRLEETAASSRYGRTPIPSFPFYRPPFAVHKTRRLTQETCQEGYNRGVIFGRVWSV
jgi:hypothetical protein